MTESESTAVEVERKWCQEPEQDADSQVLTRRQWRLFPVLAMALLLLGLAVGLGSWITAIPHPYFLPVSVDRYVAQEISPVVTAKRDARLLQEDEFFSNIRMLSVGGSQRHAMVEDLSALRLRSWRDRVVVYLTCRAGTSSNGEVNLLPSDAIAGVPETWLPLSEVLHYLDECPSRHKLLVLDILWPAADATFGILRNDVASNIESTLSKRQKDPTLLVLVPASAGEDALTCSQFGQSVFGYYFRQGLQFADGYNVQQARNGRVSVKELAAFVRQRTSRWAMQNRVVAQTPTLLGTGDSFDMAAVSPRRFQKMPQLVTPLEYPKWLEQAWLERDQWYADQVHRFNPRLLSQFEVNLLRLEKALPYSEEPDQLQAAWKATYHSLSNELAKSKAQVPTPRPTSLARLQAQQHVVNPAVVTAVNDFMTQLAAQTAGQPTAKAQAARLKLATGLRKKLGGKSAYDLAIALFDALAAQDVPDPNTIRLVDAMLRPEQPEPLFVETHFLRRMANLAGEIPPGQWPANLVRQAFQVVLKGEQAVRYPRPLRAMQSLLDPVAQNGHNGLLLLHSYGYSSPQSAETYLDGAAAGYDEALALQDLLLKAYAARDRAFWFLPNYSPLLKVDSRFSGMWRKASHDAAELAESLEPTAVTTTQAKPDSTTWLEDLRQSTLRVEHSLSALQQSFSKANVDRLIHESEQVEVSAALLAEIHSLLATPLPAAAQREALWNVRQKVSRALASRTLALDVAEDTDPGFQFTPMLDPGSESHEASLVSQRARWSIDLLHLGGWDGNGLASLERLYDAAFPENKITGAQGITTSHALRGKRAATAGKHAATASAVPTNLTPEVAETQLAQQLAEIWNQSLPQAFESLEDVRAAARLSQVFPAWLSSDALDDPVKNPVVREYVAQCRARWTWLAEQYRYAARDGSGTTFYAEASRRLSQLVELPAETYVQFLLPTLPLDLSRKDPDVRCRLPWRLVGPNKTSGPVTVQCFSPNQSVLATQVLQSPSAQGGPVVFEVSLLPGYQSANLSNMRGVVVQLDVAGRAYHNFVALPDVAGTQQFEILLGTTPTAPDPNLTRLRLRPVTPWQSYYLFVRNPTANPRSVNVQLSTGAPGLGTAQGVTATASLTVGAHATQRIEFAGDPAAAGKPLTEIAGPLDIRVTDASATSLPAPLLGHRSIPIEIADPRAYVQCDRAVFDPAGAKPNQLSLMLQASELPAGPPCVVQLVLPPERMPGFAGAARGSFRGVLPATGSSLSLFAQGLRLGEGDGSPDFFYLTVDDCQRALVFQATMPHSGQPTTPQLQIQPALRIKAPQLALASPKFTFTLESDQAPSNAQLEVQLGQSSDGGPYHGEVTERFPSARHHRFGFSPVGLKKELAFSAAIEDWQPTLNTLGIVGKRRLTCRLIAPDSTEICSVSQQVVLDNSPPEVAPLVSLPALAGTKSQLAVSVIATDDLSGVTAVTVYVGKAENGQPPKDAKLVSATVTPSNPNRWLATVTLPEGVGPATITAQATNGVGLSQLVSSTLEVVPDSNLADGQVAGSVSEGSRPQPNLAVVLLSGKTEIAKTTTGGDGKFLFAHVKPGTYTLSASKPSSLRKGETTVEVKSGTTTQGEIALAL